MKDNRKTLENTSSRKSYATFGLLRSLRQIRFAWNERRFAERNSLLLLDLVRKQEERMAHTLGRPIEGLRILEIGPGQGMERARYFSIKNQVIGMDLDVIPVGKGFSDYAQMLRQNGFGRVAKTIGRKILLGKVNDTAWEKAVGMHPMVYPTMVYGDITKGLPEIGQFDLIMSWSVFEHLSDPEKALKNLIGALRPGGVIYISLHLYTSNNGHHDIRAFTGMEGQLPLWGHLRPSTSDQIHPSSYLNKWRLPEWRRSFEKAIPGYEEFLESYNYQEKFGSLLSPKIREELRDYTDEELYTVDAVYLWRKSVEGETEENHYDA